MADFGELYGLVDEELQELSSFQDEFAGVVTGYISTQMDRDVYGMPVYVGRPVSDEDLEGSVETAQQTLKFSEARAGQLAYSMQMLRSDNQFRHYEVDGGSFRSSELMMVFRDDMATFKEFEGSIEGNLEVVSYYRDTPVEEIEEDYTEIPDFDIEDWDWPRENLWPERLEI